MIVARWAAEMNGLFSGVQKLFAKMPDGATCWVTLTWLKLARP